MASAWTRCGGVLALLDEGELADLDRLLTLIIDRSRENRAS
jgi:hypothetical protein